jgi:SAM-dependent methyltransferase
VSESLLEFYRRHRISPVRQDIHDLKAHFNRRAALYRHLGILPRFVSGRTALEIGPGSGFNSLYTASLEPSQYVLVEANPRGVDDIRDLFGRYPMLRDRIDVVSASAEEYTSRSTFDFVFCEGVLALAGLPDPTRLLWNVASHTAHGGVLVITCIDAVSDFPEVLRRLAAQLLIKPDQPLSEQVEKLLPVFSPHLSTLAGMTRRHDDWIVDNLLSPASIGPLLAIPDAIVALRSEFDVFGASPQFLTDWRWYKSITEERGAFNELALSHYWANVHNLFDYRSVWPPRDIDDNQRLYATCAAVRQAVAEFERRRDPAIVTSVIDGLDTIMTSVRSFGGPTADAIVEFAETLSSGQATIGRLATARSFGGWFGRGQQYLSFSKRALASEM